MRQKSLLILFALLFAGNVWADTIRLIDGSFDASGSWSQGAWFTPPSDGKLVLTFENPDSSADGKIEFGVGPYKMWERPILTGYVLEPAFSTNPVIVGFPSYQVEFNIYKDWGNISVGVSYSSNLPFFGGGTDNMGIDRITVDYVPETIQGLIPEAQFLTSLYSGPYEENEISVDFIAESPGKLILKATSKGSGGGGHMVYIDGYGIGGIDTGEFYSLGADYKTVPVMQPGKHILKVRHEDVYYWDNSGLRGVEVYFLPQPVTPKQISIDIKPGSYPNSINLGSKGVVPVAILSTPDFDAATVDTNTVLFAGAKPIRCAFEDVDVDEDNDVICHFPTQDLVDLKADSTMAELTGKTLDGTSIEGEDSVNIVPSKN